MALTNVVVAATMSVANDDFPVVTLHDRARMVAEIAARDANSVDSNAVFPRAAIAAAREHGLLSAMIPQELGGEGASLGEIADVCYILGQACSSTAMIVAMHQAALACVVRHHHGSSWHTSFLRRAAVENLLLASSTTEGSAGGNVRSSDAALISEDAGFRFQRAATVMSYGAQADAIVSTARRDVEASASDQSLVVLLREAYTLTPKGTWDTFGMRGTCSAGFDLDARGVPEQVLPVPYAKIHPATMVPVSHIVWAATWAGIAAAAVSRATLFVRTAARKAQGKMPPGAALATKASASLRTLRRAITAEVTRFERVADDGKTLEMIDTQASLNLFKVETSELAVATVSAAMRATGLAGYRNDGEFGIGRHLRDILSAPIMVHNERILANIATATLMAGAPATLAD